LIRPFSCASLGRLAQLIGKLQESEGFGGLMDPWQKISLYLDDAKLGEPEAEANFGPLWSSLEVLRYKTAVDPDDLVACHVDPVPENLLDREQGAILLDWEYAARSHRLWDIAYFASEARLTHDERVRLLHAFGQAEKQKEFQQWIVVAKAVSFAWCLARRARAPDERETWDLALVERRHNLQRCLEAI
jgi:thiamine kinase-like enzyme